MTHPDTTTSPTMDELREILAEEAGITFRALSELDMVSVPTALAAMSRVKTTHAGEGMVEAGNFVRCPRCLQREHPDQCTVIAPQWPDRAGVAALSPSKPAPVVDDHSLTEADNG